MTLFAPLRRRALRPPAQPAGDRPARRVRHAGTARREPDVPRGADSLRVVPAHHVAHFVVAAPTVEPHGPVTLCLRGVLHPVGECDPAGLLKVFPAHPLIVWGELCDVGVVALAGQLAMAGEDGVAVERIDLELLVLLALMNNNNAYIYRICHSG